jgi:cell division protein FtsN
MTQATGGPGLELVLDNRKLIIGFILLMIVCAAFFLFGFVEGKRQAMEAQNREQAGQASQGSPLPPPQQSSAGTETKPIEERPVQEQLDWYKKVNQKSEAEKKSATKPPAAATALPPAKKTPPPTPPAVNPAPTTTAPAAASYTVQVGAFKDRREAEKKGAELKSKGYEFSVSPLPTGLFGVRVGSFDSRAGAVEMQNRLRKDGFQTIIKTH